MTIAKRTTATAAELFERRVVRREGCWSWSGYTDAHGYARMKVGGRFGRLRGAHRVSWELYRGPIPVGLNVLHRCDNPICTNPDHLFLGTQADNVADRVAKGRPSGMQAPGARRLIGSSNPAAKLTDDEVRRVAGLASMGVRHAVIARHFKISEGYVGSLAAARRGRGARIAA